MRRTIIIIVIILVLAAMAVGVYFAWRNSQTILNPPTTGQTPVVENQRFPSVSGASSTAANVQSQTKLRVVSSQPVFDYWLAGASSSPQIYYLNQEGKILRIQTGPLAMSGAKDEAITTDAVFNIQSVKATRDGKFVIVKSGDLWSPQFTLLGVASSTKQALPNVSAAAFSPKSNQIAYLERAPNSGVANLLVKDLFGAKPKVIKITSITAADFDLSWTEPQKILLVSKPSFEYESQIWSVNIQTKALSLIGSGRGLMVNWSMDGKTGMVWSEDENRNSSLNLIGDDGSILANFDFSTLPAKCVLSQPKFYCALPQIYNSPLAPILPDDYLKRAVYSEDFIYAIDSAQNSFEPIFAGSEPAIDATHLEFSGNGLYFINRYDNELYSLDLQ